jgi:hypothetical protein
MAKNGRSLQPLFGRFRHWMASHLKQAWPIIRQRPILAPFAVNGIV